MTSRESAAHFGRMFAAALLVCAAPAAARAGGGTVTGRVEFEGAPPERTPVQFGGEKQCALIHGGQAPLTETVVVNDNKTLRNVLVYVTGEVPGTYAPPAEPVVYQQEGCVFKPHVAAVMVGQAIEVINDDALLHNTRAQSKKGQAFNIAQPVKGMKARKMMKAQEIGIPLKCDVHFWMVAYLHVLAHPFFAVTGEDGRFSIAGLPAGTYTLEAWHEKLGTKTLTVTVAEGAEAAANFSFAGP